MDREGVGPSLTAFVIEDNRRSLACPRRTGDDRGKNFCGERRFEFARDHKIQKATPSLAGWRWRVSGLSYTVFTILMP
jgi:hypothetical protein